MPLPLRVIVVLCLLHLVALRSAYAMGIADEEFLYCEKELRQVRGVAAIVGEVCNRFPADFARLTEFTVHVVARSPEDAEAARAEASRLGVDMKRLAIETMPLDPLPYADNSLDVLVGTGVTEADIADLSVAEVARVLRPGGVALVTRARGVADYKLRAWARHRELAAAPFRRPNGLALTKRWPDGLDEWSHWQHGPDMNPVSSDEVIRAPFMTQFLAEPFYSTMPSFAVISGGRQFRVSGHMAIHDREIKYLNTLFASDAFNGQQLWTRPIPEGFLVHRSMMVAAPEALYLLEPRRCVVLDPATGLQIDQITHTAGGGYWRAIMMQEGILYALLGGEEADAEIIKRHRPHGAWGWDELSEGYYTDEYPWGYGHALVAMRPGRSGTLWEYESDEPIDSRALCMAGGRIFAHSEGRALRCLDARTGNVLWETADPRLLSAIMEGNDTGLGFKTTPYAICTDEYLFLAGRGRKNVVAVSARSGEHLWTIPGAYNATNLLFSRGNLYAHIPTLTRVDPRTGESEKALDTWKRSCARFTGCPDSLFHRGSLAEHGGEGTLRYDAASEEPSVTRAFRPACNDGIIPAQGLLHITPWDCDCNLQLMGEIGLAPAGDFDFDRPAREAERLQIFGEASELLEVREGDWPTYLADNARSSSSAARVPAEVRDVGRADLSPIGPTVPTMAGGLAFVGGRDGSVRAFATANGEERWVAWTAGPIRLPPSVADGRVYAGSGDGYVYCFEAATGEALWRFRAAPAERRIMVFGSLCSTWPVNSGVLVEDGVAYAASGIINYDGTYVYALDAATGRLRWENNTSGHLNEQMREGVSVQGCLASVPGGILLAGGNLTGPSFYNGRDGACPVPAPEAGWPQGARGSEVGLFLGRFFLSGGHRLFTDPEDPITNWQGFSVIGRGVAGNKTLPGRTPPARNDRHVIASGMGPLICVTADEVVRWATTEGNDVRLQPAWVAPSIQDSVALAITPNAALAAGRLQGRDDAYALQAFDVETGELLWSHDLPGAPMPGGLAIDADGTITVLTEAGGVVMLAA